MVDFISGGALSSRPQRFKEIRRGEFAPEMAIADTSIPGSGLFFSTDNEMMVAPRVNVFRAESTGTLDSSLWTAAMTGTGTGAHSGGELIVSTGTTANSTARLTTPKSMRQMAGSTQYYITVVRLSDLGVANNVRRWGIYNDTNGFFFQLDGTTFSVGHRSNSVDTLVPYASCNGPATETFNPATDLMKMNQFNIFYGGLSCRWQVNGRVLHGIGGNTITSPLTQVLANPFRYESNNSGGQTANAKLFGRGVSFSRVSPSEVTPRYINIVGAATTVVRSGAGTLRRMIFNNSQLGTVTIYDNTAASGDIVATMSPTGTGNPYQVEFDVEVSIGITVVTSHANMNMTVTFD